MKVKITQLRVTNAPYFTGVGAVDVFRVSDGHKIAMLDNGHFAVEAHGKRVLITSSQVANAFWEPADERPASGSR